MQLRRSWPSGKGWLISLLSTLDGLVWRRLTNAPAFSASCLPDVPEKLSKTLKRPHLALVRTRCQVPTKSGRSFPLCRRSIYLFFRCLWFGARKSPQKLRRFSRTETKKNTASSVQTPYQAPPQMSAQQAAHVTQAVLFATGWNYRPAGGDEVVSRGTLYRKKNTQKGYCWTGGTHFFGFLSYDMACFLDVRKVKPTGSTY